MKVSVLKALVFILLIANVLFFAARYLGYAGYKPPSRTEPKIPSIELLESTELINYNSESSERLSSCYSLGPYTLKYQAAELAGKIISTGIDAIIRKQRTLNVLKYFVYLSPFDSRAAAESVVEDIKKQEVKNYSIVNTGPYRNAIAFGIFENLDKAKRHAEYIRLLGYDAKYTEQINQSTVFWIEYDEPFGANLPTEKWSAEVVADSYIQKVPRECRQVS